MSKKLLFLFVCCISFLLADEISSDLFLEKRISPSDRRYPTFSKVLTMLEKVQAKTCIETGTSRNGDQNFAGDGDSTIIFSHWASLHQAHFYSVDIDPIALKNAEASCLPYYPHVDFICSDSIDFLTRFSAPIDFLYLDSYDFDRENPTPSQKHHFKEIMAAYPHLSPRCIVMIDDCDLPHGGKGKLAINFLLRNKWQIISKNYQVILVRKEYVDFFNEL
jgi:hypothetical protein